MYPGRHGLRVQHLLCYVILYPSFPVRDRAPGATNWEHDGVSAHVSGSARVEFSLDVFGQTRYAVWVLLRAWEAETERQLGRRICRQDSGNGRVRNLERFKTDVTRRIGVGLGILWNGGNRSGECWGGRKETYAGEDLLVPWIYPCLSMPSRASRVSWKEQGWVRTDWRSREFGVMPLPLQPSLCPYRSCLAPRNDTSHSSAFHQQRTRRTNILPMISEPSTLKDNGQDIDASDIGHSATYLSASCISGSSVSNSPASSKACRRFANSASNKIFFSAAASF